MRGIPLDKEHRLARTGDGHVDFIGYAPAARQDHIVPEFFPGIVALDPQQGVGLPRSCEFEVVGGVDKPAVGAHGLHRVPYFLMERGMQKHLGGIDENYSSLGGVEHTSEIV